MGRVERQLSSLPALLCVWVLISGSGDMLQHIIVLFSYFLAPLCSDPWSLCLGVCHLMDSAQNALVFWFLSTEFLDLTTGFCGSGRAAAFCLPSASGTASCPFLSPQVFVQSRKPEVS